MSTSLLKKSPDSQLKPLSASAACRRLIASGVSISTASAICRRAIAAGLSLGAAAAFSPSALADNTKNVEISATVPLILDVSASELTIEVPLDHSAINNLNVGSITVRSNAPNGYKLTVRSASDGVLNWADNSTEKSVPYTLSYDGASPVSLRGTAETPLAVENKTSANADFLACATSTGCNRSLNISVKDSDAKNKPAGIYRDTLKFNIIAN